MVPVPNDLMDTGTESEFAPWDPSKAHILVSTPESCDFFWERWHGGGDGESVIAKTLC